MPNLFQGIAGDERGGAGVVDRVMLVVASKLLRGQNRQGVVPPRIEPGCEDEGGDLVEGIGTVATPAGSTEP